MFGGILAWLARGPLDKVLSLVDKKITAETDREALKADVIREHMRTRAGWLEAGGLMLTIPFVAVVFMHFGSVAVYSMFWCDLCAYPKTWKIAALPEPMDQWEAWIIMSAIGVHGLNKLGLRK